MVDVHLISAPWASPLFAPISIETLASFLRRESGLAEARIHTWPAHFAIPCRVDGLSFGDVYNTFSRYGESVYFALYYQRYLGALHGAVPPEALRDNIARTHRRRTHDGELDPQSCAAIARATQSFLEELPLDAADLHLVGFSLNYEQTYASLFMAKMLLELYPEHRFVFVFGGACASYPATRKLLFELGLDAFVVVGEGERKLAGIVESCRRHEDEPAELLRSAIEAPERGILHASDQSSMFERNPAWFEAQISALSSLPLPDYSSFLEFVEESFASREQFDRVKHLLRLPVEGTRGCFAKCDFCSLNQGWDGFRKMSAGDVVDRARRTVHATGINSVFFVDNVCDTWAEGYAELLLREGRNIDAFMELRAHHPQEFWAKLRQAGVSRVQVGIEAIAPSLLAEMRKGTRAIQNLRTMKYLRELGYWTGNNLIIHHPRSTTADIAFTRRMLEQIPHFGPLTLSSFVLEYGSPLYKELADGSREHLRLELDYQVPEPLLNFAVGTGYTPATPLAAEVVEAWNAFTDWHSELNRRIYESPPSMTVDEEGAESVVRDRRRPEAELEHRLAGVARDIHRICHQGPTYSQLEAKSLLPSDGLRCALDELIDAGLVLEVDGYYLTLALRSAEEVIQSLRADKVLPISSSRAALRARVD